MNNIFKIAKHEFTKVIKSLGFIISTSIVLIIALVVALLMNFVFNDNNNGQLNQNIGYVDQSSLIAHGGAYGYYEQETGTIFAGNFSKYDDEEQAKRALLNNDVQIYIVFPADYINGGQIVYYTMNADLLVNTTSLVMTMQSFITDNLVGSAVDQATIDRLSYAFDANKILLDINGNSMDTFQGAGKYIAAIVMVMLLVICLFTASGYLIQSLSEEKENRIMEVLLSSVSSKELLYGKVLGLGFLGLTQVLIWLAGAVIVFQTLGKGILDNILSGISISPSFIVITLIIFILGYSLFAFLLGGFSIIGASSKESQQYSMYFIIPSMVPLWFSGFIIGDSNGTLAQILTYFPLTAPSTIIMREAIGSLPAWQLLIGIAVLIASIILAAWLAHKMFRTFLLMYGKTPSLKEIIKVIKET
ncbi:MAG: ABC transporter permease [Chloroflexi bacterium]|nr:ABC transporter permease [Chloroflexota bacterium]